MKKKVLILEDDDINQELVELYLIDDYELKIVDSVAEAINAISAEKFDLIISDLNLGTDSKSDGLFFLQHIKSDIKFKHIPIVVYSGYVTPNMNNEYSFDACISKPITKSEFLKIIAEILENH